MSRDDLTTICIMHIFICRMHNLFTANQTAILQILAEDPDRKLTPF